MNYNRADLLQQMRNDGRALRITDEDSAILARSLSTPVSVNGVLQEQVIFDAGLVYDQDAEHLAYLRGLLGIGVVSATWGTIIGTLSDQADLSNALNTRVSYDAQSPTAAQGTQARTNLSLVPSSAGAVIYVSKSTTATDTRTGLSAYDPAAPFSTIGAAIAAASDGDVIIVRPGTYTAASFSIPTGVSIIGSGRSITIIQATGSVNPITAAGQNYFADITFYGSHASLGKGMVLTDAQVEASNCRFHGVADALQLIYSTGRSSFYDCDFVSQWDCVITSETAVDSSAENYFYNCRLEATGPYPSSNCRALYCPGGYVELNNCLLNARNGDTGQPTRPIMLSNADGGAPTVRVIGGRIYGASINGNVTGCYIENGGVLILQNPVIVADDASGVSIDADTAVTVNAYGAYTNKSAGVNITIAPTTGITVDASVV